MSFGTADCMAWTSYIAHKQYNRLVLVWLHPCTQSGFCYVLTETVLIVHVALTQVMTEEQHTNYSSDSGIPTIYHHLGISECDGPGGVEVLGRFLRHFHDHIPVLFLLVG